MAFLFTRVASDSFPMAGSGITGAAGNSGLGKEGEGVRGQKDTRVNNIFGIHLMVKNLKKRLFL